MAKDFLPSLSCGDKARICFALGGIAGVAGTKVFPNTSLSALLLALAVFVGWAVLLQMGERKSRELQRKADNRPPRP